LADKNDVATVHFAFVGFKIGGNVAKECRMSVICLFIWNTTATSGIPTALVTTPLEFLTDLMADPCLRLYGLAFIRGEEGEEVGEEAAGDLEEPLFFADVLVMLKCNSVRVC
jgi:hypothetical protein